MTASAGHSPISAGISRAGKNSGERNSQVAPIRFDRPDRYTGPGQVRDHVQHRAAIGSMQAGPEP